MLHDDTPPNQRRYRGNTSITKKGLLQISRSASGQSYTASRTLQARQICKDITDGFVHFVGPDFERMGNMMPHFMQETVMPKVRGPTRNARIRLANSKPMCDLFMHAD
jgi:hypothetical protein